jgi:protein phosphatase
MTELGTVRAAAVTGRGSVRDHNEDAVLVFEWLSHALRPQLVELASELTPPLVCAVADGLGGHPAGAVASRMALTALAAGYTGWTDATTAREGLLAISDAVYEAGERRPDRAGMRTTITGLVVGASEVLWFNVGDSRAYRITDGYVEQLSADDAVLDAAGRPTGAVTQTIGDSPRQPVTPHLGLVPLAAGMPTRLLLCSDGVHGPVDEPLLRRLCREPDLRRLVVSLRDAAYQAGAPDNLSVVAVDVTPPAEPAPPHHAES